jgi:hypothetical protein
LLGDDLPKTFEWYKIKLPHYNYNNKNTTANFENDFTPSISEEVSFEKEGNSSNDVVEK